MTVVTNSPLVEDLYDSILEAEKELLLTELLSYENTTSSTVLDDDISSASVYTKNVPPIIHVKTDKPPLYTPGLTQLWVHVVSEE